MLFPKMCLVQVQGGTTVNGEQIRVQEYLLIVEDKFTHFILSPLISKPDDERRESRCMQDHLSLLLLANDVTPTRTVFVELLDTWKLGTLSTYPQASLRLQQEVARGIALEWLGHTAAHFADHRSMDVCKASFSCLLMPMH
jgi:hypothetical protein